MALLATKIQQIQKKSDNAISVFRKTVSDLTSVNDQIDDEIFARQAQINKLRDEKDDLIAISDENERFIDKITEFLS